MSVIENETDLYIGANDMLVKTEKELLPTESQFNFSEWKDENYFNPHMGKKKKDDEEDIDDEDDFDEFDDEEDDIEEDDDFEDEPVDEDELYEEDFDFDDEEDLLEDDEDVPYN